ncbi:DMT family transporter [Desulfospira joergensenii]|uniref:DMT family transporter n=1 Tax=Desulfospira joergensenii TaxID=53329 RepID=UPI00041D35B4|nr:DMT family transporter [Desulfospira joergensenii]
MTDLNHTSAVLSAPKNKNRFVHALMLLNILLIASSFPVGASITNALPPAVMMSLRFMLAALLFAPYVLVRNGFQLPSLRSMTHYIIISIPLVIFFWCMFESLRYTTLLNAGALFTLVPTVTAVFAAILNKDSISRARALGLFVGTLGAVWIVFRGDISALANLNLNYGDIVFFIGCLALGLYNVLIKKLYQNEPMELLTFWVLLWGSVWLSVISLQDMEQINWKDVGLNVYAGVAYLSIFTTLITFFLMQFSIVRIGAAKASAYNFITPVFVILLSIISGMERFIPVTVPGILLVVTAMVLIQRDKGGKK